MWLCHRISVFLLCLISDPSLRSKHIPLICIFSLYYLKMFHYFCFAPHTISSCCLLKHTATTWIKQKLDIKWNQSGKTSKTKTHLHSSYLLLPRVGAWEISESQPRSSQQQNYCLWCWACRGSSFPALLHLSVGLRGKLLHAGGRAFILLKTTAVLQKSRRKKSSWRVRPWHFISFHSTNSGVGYGSLSSRFYLRNVLLRSTESISSVFSFASSVFFQKKKKSGKLNSTKFRSCGTEMLSPFVQMCPNYINYIFKYVLLLLGASLSPPEIR